jgi:hypothetical protein
MATGLATITDTAIAKRPQAKVIIACGIIAKADGQRRCACSRAGAKGGPHWFGVNPDVIFPLFGVFTIRPSNTQFYGVFSRFAVGVAGVVAVAAGITITKIPLAVVVVTVGVVIKFYPEWCRTTPVVGVKVGIRLVIRRA